MQCTEYTTKNDTILKITYLDINIEANGSVSDIESII